MGLEERKRQVFGESIPGTLPPTNDYITTQMAIQRHEAKKAGEHFDVRFLVNGKGVSFVTRKGFPTNVGEIRRLVRMPNHRPDYMHWEGTIPEGQYGAGRVTLHDAQDVVLKSEPDKMLLDVHSGPNAGRYAIIKHWHDWFMVKRKDFDKNWVEREKFKQISEPSKIPNYDDYIALQKLDGANFIATVNPHGISYTSAHKSKDNQLISREDAVPHLRDIKLPARFAGMVVRGELWHPTGFNILSGMLNSKPTNAIISQQEYGKVLFSPFDIERMPDGRKGSEVPFEEKLNILRDLVRESKSKYINLPEYAVQEKKEFEDKIFGNKEQEGIVYRHKSDPDAPTYKTKNYYDYDLRVGGLVPGAGRLVNKAIGALRLLDAQGKFVGHVGSGLNDALRKDMFLHPEKYIDKIVKIKTMQPLTDKLRAPVFMGLSDKTEADSLDKKAAAAIKWLRITMRGA